MNLLPLYRFGTDFAAPLGRLLLRRREGLGREDSARIAERQGIASLERPKGFLVWLHAASVGEAISILALVQALLAERQDCHALVTTGTVTSARLMAERLPERAFHQYVPLDLGPWVRRFLDHWRPELAIWVESEFWPNLLIETEGRGIPILLVNARMSPESLRGWQKAPGTARRLLACFRCCLAQDEAQAERLRALGAQQVIVTGNLKFAAEPLPVDQAELERLRALLADRPCWLAASTHDPEEALIAEAHDRLASAFPRLLTILVPRHPGRGEEIEAALRASGLRTARRARGDSPGSETDIYLADTLGELGLWFRLAPVTFMGGSLVPIGGHNPLEPARLGTAILHGRHMENFRVVAQALDRAGGSRQVDGPHDLAEAVAALLQKPDEAQALAAAAAAVAQSEDAVLDQVMAHLRAFLPQALDQTA